MNRATALLLAMAALLAHTLTIHLDFERHFAPPYGFAHVAFRIARNFVRADHFAWNHDPLEGGLGSYPSPLWVLVAAVAERLGVPWLEIRALSNLAGQDSRFDFAQFVEEVASSSARILRRLLPVL